MNFFIDFSIKILHIQVSCLNIFILKLITEINLLLTLYGFLIYMKRKYIFYYIYIFIYKHNKLCDYNSQQT